MWYRLAIRTPKLLSNPVEGGFWAGDRFIDYGEKYSIKDWSLLLNKPSIGNVATSEEKFHNYLLRSTYRKIEGRKTFISGPKTAKQIILENPIVGGFWVEDRFIEYGESLNVREWYILLKTQSNNFNTPEKLKDYLDKHEFKYINDRKTYIPKNSGKILLSNPVIGGFFVEDRFIEYGKKLAVSSWVKLLSTDHYKVNDQNKLNVFLDKAIFKEIDGKKTFISGKKGFKNPIVGGFWVGDRFIDYGESLVGGVWKELLSTDSSNVNSQENLNTFLLSSKFKLDENNNKIYVRSFTSKRERLLNNLSFNESEQISIRHHYPIKIFNSQFKKETLFYLDLAFIRNAKVILVTEINGRQHYGFVPFRGSVSSTYETWQQGLQRDILKINYCHNNNIPLLIFHHLLSDEEFKTIIINLNKNPNIYDKYIPQPVIDENITNTSEEFIKRQIYSHLYPVFNNVISFNNEESKKRYIKDTLILISKLIGIYKNGIDKTDYIKAFDSNVDLTANYNICLAIYNSLYPDYPLDRDEKITYSDLSKKPTIQKPKEIEQNPLDN